MVVSTLKLDFIIREIYFIINNYFSSLTIENYNLKIRVKSCLLAWMFSNGHNNAMNLFNKYCRKEDMDFGFKSEKDQRHILSI